MIRVTCPSCQSKLHAKDELAGQTKKCPKCGAPLLIAAAAPAPSTDDSAVLARAGPDQHPHGWAQEPLPGIPAPERLERLNQYLICDSSKLFAAWENNGQGWMLRTTAGFIGAARNSERLPSQGDFKLVELKMAMVDDALRLEGLSVYQLAQRWALTILDRGDDRILGVVTGPGCLNKEQKSAVRRHIREHFMRTVWEHADAVINYLTDTDYHSPGVAAGPAP